MILLRPEPSRQNSGPWSTSVTKTFTATAILLLMQEGKLDLDAKITDTIPDTVSVAVPYKGAGLPEIERKMQKVGNFVKPGKIEKLLIKKLNSEPDSK